jgi:flagellar basal-body rod protein FlgG
VRSVAARRSFDQGPLLETGSSLDLALEGAGFFQVRRADGSIALTRAGGFRLDASGAIVTAVGERLEPGIAVPASAGAGNLAVAASAGAGNLAVAADGTVSAGGLVLGRIAVVDVPAPERLTPLGGGLFVPTVASGAPRPAEAAIRQGYVEGANVDLAEEMVETIVSTHELAASAATVRAADEQLAELLRIRR